MQHRLTSCLCRSTRSEQPEGWVGPPQPHPHRKSWDSFQAGFSGSESRGHAGCTGYQGGRNHPGGAGEPRESAAGWRKQAGSKGYPGGRNQPGEAGGPDESAPGWRNRAGSKARNRGEPPGASVGSFRDPGRAGRGVARGGSAENPRCSKGQGSAPCVHGGRSGGLAGISLDAKLYSKLHLHSLQTLVSQRRYLERQKPTSEARGGMRGK
jgi:hypothetical protein